MRFRCPFCFYTVSVDESFRGYPVTCPGCSRQLIAPVSRLQDGCMLGDFQIKSKIGAGSIGSVYSAIQISLERQVALKILSPEYTNHIGIQNFLKEARATASLNHINLVQSFAVGEEDGICYMAMNYIQGESVMTRIRREHHLPIDESLHIIQQAAEALHYAWQEQGIIHRDIKPDNIMITNEQIVKLTDLGLATTSTEWQADTDISGSPSYMAPELFTGCRPDPRSDIYSLGITLYQMLTGELPYQAKTVRTLAYQHLEEEPVPPDKKNPDIPPGVSRLISSMIAKNPDKRFQNMDDLLKEIWQLRQKTAPNKNLIPDVHTLSMRYLNYDIQKKSVQTHAEVNKLQHEVRSRKKRLRITLFMIPVAVILGISVTLFWYGNTPIRVSAESELVRQIFYLERLAKDDTIPLRNINDEAEGMIRKFGRPSNSRQRLLLDRVRSIVISAELRREKIDNRNLRFINSNLRVENARLRLLLKSKKEQKDPEK